MTYLSLGLIGHGSVALIHARALGDLADVRLAGVFGRDLDRARRFAAPLGASAFDRLDPFLDGLDAVIVASPSAAHVGHATSVLRAGVSALVALPAAPDGAALDRLAGAAGDGARLLATHTARYLPATAATSRVLTASALGRIRSVSIERQVRVRDRAWVDDPLLHHGQHAIDLCATWFERVDVRDARWADGGRRVQLQALVGEDIAATIDIAHDATRDAQRIRIVGSDGTLTSDGFGIVSTDPGEPGSSSDIAPEDAYHAAIADQDAAFVGALRGKAAYPAIALTRANTAVVERARRLADG